MTLVVAATSPKSIWMLTDRRISFRHRAPKDDARKVMSIEAKDGVALLGYAGLGSTGTAVEPSDWMARVLRGRDLPLEKSLGILASAAKTQLPRHLDDLRWGGEPAHHIIAAAFLNREPRLYSIDLVQVRARSGYRFRFTRHVAPDHERFGQKSVFLAIGGSGAVTLHSHRRPWHKELKKVIKAHDRGDITPRAVAGHFARLNHDVHSQTLDKTVGDRCIVAWRLREGGGAFELFAGTSREVATKGERGWPQIAGGMDVNALVEVMMPHLLPRLEGLLRGKPVPEIDNDAINAALRNLPDTPDESLP